MDDVMKDDVKGPDVETIYSALEVACRAPSVHNTQPWRWVIAPHSLHLFADSARRLPVIDASGRELIISCGATLHHVRSAFRALGWRADAHRLPNPADRDHCLQYMVAIGLIFGELTADHYEDRVAADPRIDALRAKMKVTEDKSYSKDYLDPEKRSIANAVQVFFQDGSKTGRIEVHFPIGHRRRRAEGIPVLQQKARDAFAAHYGAAKAGELMALFANRAKLEAMPVHEFVGAFVK